MRPCAAGAPTTTASWETGRPLRAGVRWRCPELADVVQLALGYAHTCARLRMGTVLCWGSNAYGQLGVTMAAGPVATAVSGIAGAVEIAAGGYHTCARLMDGSVRCWGRNMEGQLGNGTSSNTAAPVSVTGVSAAAGIAAGGFHTCVWLVDGDVRCWGYGGDGELGDGTTESHSTPVVTAELSEWSRSRPAEMAPLCQADGWQRPLLGVEPAEGQVAAGGGDAFLAPVRGAASGDAGAWSPVLNHTCALLQGRHV